MSKLKISRIFTDSLESPNFSGAFNNNDPYSTIQFKSVKSTIKNLDGSVAMASDNLIVPIAWSDIAVDVLARNYIRKRGVPKHLKLVHEPGIPEWLSRRVVDENAKVEADELYGAETDARQVFDRLAGAWTYWGFKSSYFDTEQDARNYFDEMRYMLATQMGAPNSPQWFNTGLYWAYGIDGPAQGHYYFDEQTSSLQKSTSAYERPQPHACFIQSVRDDLVNEGGIMDLWKNEARLFKFGSGTGTNFSTLRGEGEALSGGGYSSGVMSFLRIGDVAGGSIKSGGTTRRAAKMVILNVDHPDIEKFINWKVNEESKVIDLVVGSKVLKKHTEAMKETFQNPVSLKKVIKKAREDEVPDSYLVRVLDTLRNGGDVEKVVHTTDWDSGAYTSVFGQNSNNTVRVDDAFLDAVENDSDFSLKWRTDGRVCKTLKARYLWDQIAKAAWSCADPGLQFDTTINAWHTCSNDDRINGSNPCSEYMFLDDTACNLASMNLCKFLKKDSDSRLPFDMEKFKHATRLWTLTLEISVAMAQFPTKAIAQRSYEYRTLGLGYGNLGALLMQAGIGYDSNEGRSVAAGITALMQGVAYETSAEIAKCMGAFARYNANADAMMRVMRNHFIAAYGGEEALAARLSSANALHSNEKNIQKEGYQIGFSARINSAANDISNPSVAHQDNQIANYANLNVKPVPFKKEECIIRGLGEEVEKIWDKVLQMGNSYGFRNAQVSVIAPTGTIGLVMDFKTTGIEPQFGHIVIKQLAGGGVWRMVNDEIAIALNTLRYSPAQIDEINKYVVGHGNLNGSIKLNTQWLRSKGLLDTEIAKIEENLKKSFKVTQAFTRYSLDQNLLNRLGISEAEYTKPDFNLLSYFGATKEEIEEADKFACGHMTIEGAPHIQQEHLSIFDCARPCGDGVRYLSWQSHVKMMAAIQPFLSGAISKTINLPNDATIEDCANAYMASWHLGLKAVALYRDGSKYSQVLGTNKQQELDSLLNQTDSATAVFEEDYNNNIAKAQNSTSIKKEDEDTSANSNPEQADSAKTMRMAMMEKPEFKPFRRRGYTQHVLIDGSSLWHTTGEDEDGRLTNLLLTYGKEGTTLSGWASAWGRILSMYLHDKGNDALVRVYKAFKHSKFEPMGEVQGHPYIKHSSSIPDYIVEDLVVAYPDMLNAPFSGSKLPPQRNGKINKIKIGQETMYIIIGEDQFGKPAEFFVAGIGNEGSDLKGWMSSCAKLISLYFQDCGDSAIWQFIHAFEGSSFDPSGFVEGHPNIKFATSPLDFLAKHLRITYANVLNNEQLKLPFQSTENEKNVQSTGSTISAAGSAAQASQSTMDKQMELQIRAMSGYKVDEPCKSCRAFKLRYNGTCFICDSCFTTTGCS